MIKLPRLHLWRSIRASTQRSVEIDWQLYRLTGIEACVPMMHASKWDWMRRIGLEKRTRLKLFDGEWVEVWESPEVVRQKLGLKVDEG